MWSLIETWAALPRKSEAYLTERQWFDLKGWYDPDERAEMAKDVAAFANAQGGAIIIGAKEGPTEPDYSKPLEAAHAKKVEDGFDKAVRDNCRPTPTIHVRQIASPDTPGKVVLVINVEPALDLVAAHHAKDNDAWRFPLRVGRHTQFIRPEELPLHMNTKARRAKLLLHRALDAGGDIDFYHVVSGTSDYIEGRNRDVFRLLAVDARGGGAALLVGLLGEFKDQPIAIPLDDVEAVWQQHDERWAMRISGRVAPFVPVDGPRQHLVYYPPGTFTAAPLGNIVKKVADHAEAVAHALAGTLLVQHFERQEPSESDIREVAHQRWLMRDKRGLPGSPEADWLHARRFLLHQRRDG